MALAAVGPFRATIVTTGLRELVYAADRASEETKGFVRDELAQVAVPVRDEARSLMATYSPKTAAGYEVKTMAAGRVDVYQRLTKTTGKRPDWGAFQMTHALIPALERKAGEIEHSFGHFLDRLIEEMGA